MSIGGLVASAFIVGLSGAMAPGSLLVVVLTETVRHGLWGGPAAVAGHGAIEMIMVVVLSIGLGRILSYPPALGTIGLVGGLMLLWFGWSTFRTAGSAVTAISSARSALSSKDSSFSTSASCAPQGNASLLNTAFAGVVASISNPYWILWWATVGAANVAAGLQYGFVGPAAFFIGHISSDFVWYALVSLAAATGAKFLGDKIYRWVLRSCAIFLVVFGLYFLSVGAKFILSK